MKRPSANALLRALESLVQTTKRPDGDWMTLQEIMSALKLGRTATQDRMRKLKALGQLEQFGKPGSRTYYRFKNGKP